MPTFFRLPLCAVSAVGAMLFEENRIFANSVEQAAAASPATSSRVRARRLLRGDADSERTKTSRTARRRRPIWRRGGSCGRNCPIDERSLVGPIGET